jgi:hypothetical protein
LIDALSCTIGQAFLTTQFALALIADLSGRTDLIASSTMQTTGVEIDATACAIGQTLLTTELTLALIADFTGSTSPSTLTAV